MTDRCHNKLQEVVDEDVEEILRKEKTYQGSWKKRGGVGAAMMVLRKMDRLEIILEKNHYDIFEACQWDMSGKDGSALAEIRDLRRYLILVEAEMLTKKEPNRPGTPEDGGHHATQQFENEPDGDDYAQRAEWKARCD